MFVESASSPRRRRIALPANFSREKWNLHPWADADATNDGLHHYACAVCGQTVDPRKLGDVLHHEQAQHEQTAEAPARLRPRQLLARVVMGVQRLRTRLYVGIWLRVASTRMHLSDQVGQPPHGA